MATDGYQSIKRRTRLELGDDGDPFRAVFRGDGNTLDFDLPVRVVEGVTVRLDGQEIPPADFSVQPRAGTIGFYTPPAEDTTIIVEGMQYDLFTDEQVDVFILSALNKHGYNRLPERSPEELAEEVSAVERHPIAVLAAIEGLWAALSQIARDISVQSPDGYSVDRSRRYQQMLQLVEQKQEEYDELAKQLNVGLSRIEVMQLRRVSRRTGRLVPVYRPQEIDETDAPVRVWPPRDAIASEVNVMAEDEEEEEDEGA